MKQCCPSSLDILAILKAEKESVERESDERSPKSKVDTPGTKWYSLLPSMNTKLHTGYSDVRDLHVTCM